MTGEERAPKKRKSIAHEDSHSGTEDEQARDSMEDSHSIPENEPEGMIDVYAEGDAIIVVAGFGGVDKPMGTNVSSHVLSLASSVFKQLFADQQHLGSNQILNLLSEDGPSLLLLFNILHLRNDALPPRLPPDDFLRFIACAAKYACLTAVSRAASQWLDHIYYMYKAPDPPLFKMVEATLLLDDAIYFARFTSRWVLETKMGQMIAELIGADSDLATKRLAIELLARQKQCLNELKADLDLLIEPLSDALASENKHHYDVCPGDQPDEPTDVFCTIDNEAANLYLSALRDANLWPAPKWRHDTTLRSILDRADNFKIPEFDTSEECYWCVHVSDLFVTAVEAVRKIHEGRLWGLCLDCHKAGGRFQGECRFEHVKARIPVFEQESGPERLVNGLTGAVAGQRSVSAPMSKTSAALLRADNLSAESSSADSPMADANGGGSS